MSRQLGCVLSLFLVHQSGIAALNAQCVSTADSPGVERTLNPGSIVVVTLDTRQDYRLTAPADGVWFDINGDGLLERLAWTREQSNVGFLVIDSNGNGSIDNGTELFGNYTVPEASNGFDALRVLNMATNGGIPKGAVDVDDPLFERLLLWFDRNHNGISELDELYPAAEFLSAIGVGYQILGRTDQHGNRFRFRGWVHVRTAEGRNEVRSRDENNERTRDVWDVFLKIAQ